MNYLKRQGQASGAIGPVHWRSGSRRWADVERGDETGKEKQID
jgi:hypothetical protein